MPDINNTMVEQLEAVLPHILVLLAASVSLDLYLLLRFIRRSNRWRQLATLLKTRPWSWYDAALVLLGLLGAQVALHLVAAICLRCGIDLEHISSRAPLILGVIVFHLPALVVATFVLRMKQLTVRDAFGLRRESIVRDTAHGTVLSVAVIAPVLLASVLGTYIMLRCELQIEEQDAVAVFRSVAMRPWWLQASLVLLAVTVVPVAEEILFRGIALPLLARRLGAPLAIVIVSLLFAVLHFHVSAYAPLFVLSLTFCLAYLLSGSILVPVVMHGAFNFVMISLITLQGAQ